MSAATAHLRVVTEDGELVEYEGCPDCKRMGMEVEEITRRLKGALLEARSAREERYARAWGHPDRPQVELLHTLHRLATDARPDQPSRKKALDATEIENTLACLNVLGFRECVKAVVGLTFDPSRSRPRRNGTRETFNTYELCFRNSTKAASFAERAPIGYEPDAEKIAAAAGADPKWVASLLREEGK